MPQNFSEPRMLPYLATEPLKCLVQNGFDALIATWPQQVKKSMGKRRCILPLSNTLRLLLQLFEARLT